MEGDGWKWAEYIIILQNVGKVLLFFFLSRNGRSLKFGKGGRETLVVLPGLLLDSFFYIPGLLVSEGRSVLNQSRTWLHLPLTNSRSIFFSLAILPHHTSQSDGSERPVDQPELLRKPFTSQSSARRRTTNGNSSRRSSFIPRHVLGK